MKTETGTDMELAERKDLIAAAVKEADSRPDAERIMIKWRGKGFNATVILLPVDSVVLNPKSHRIKAQLESSESRDAILDDPLSKEAQEAISDLLRQEEQFKDLKRNLKDSGQLEPGVVTADGMLVNANTRCVALRDNGAEYIRAAVLPSDADQREIDRLELALQMKRDFKSDYTFTNELLFVDDLIKSYNYTPEKVATEMGWASMTDTRGINREADRVRQHQRILALIRELQYMSDNRIPLVEFDARRQALTEIDDETETLKKSDKPVADEVKYARLSGMLLDVGYRDLRKISRDFVEEYLIPAMEERSFLKPHIDVLTAPEIVEPSSIPGLDIFNTSGSEITPPRTARRILKMLTESVGESEIILGKIDGETSTIGKFEFVGEMKTAFEGAAEDARLNEQEGDSLFRPIELTRKAQKQVKAAIAAYGEIKSHPDFDLATLRLAVEELRSGVTGLSEAVTNDDADI